MKAVAGERGSASVEFVALALPLLIPTLIFFTAMSHMSTDKINGSEIARTSVHAFVLAENDYEGYARVASLVNRYQELKPGRQLSFAVQCSTRPCITPESVVEVTIFREGDEGRIRIGSARSSVGRWN